MIALWGVLGCFSIGNPSKTYLKRNSHAISIVSYLFLGCRIVLKFYTEHWYCRALYKNLKMFRQLTKILWKNRIWWDLSFGRMSYILHQPLVSVADQTAAWYERLIHVFKCMCLWEDVLDSSFEMHVRLILFVVLWLTRNSPIITDWHHIDLVTLEWSDGRKGINYSPHHSIAL